VSIFRGNVSVHIRKFQKYGNIFYPTKVGITLHPEWIPCIMDRENVPQTPQEIDAVNLLQKEQMKIDTVDFENFTFSRIRASQNDVKTINLTSVQWSEMMRQYDDISTVVVDHIYAFMDFYTAYSNIEGVNIDQTLPSSLDISIGTQCLLEQLKNSIADCIKEKGGLKDPLIYAEELWANKIKSFNLAALTIDVVEIADSFYRKLWEDKDFLLLSKPALYITKDFLCNIKLQDVLKDVRNILCPPYTSEYFEYL